MDFLDLVVFALFGNCPDGMDTAGNPAKEGQPDVNKQG
jgi:hypothetical protein